MRLTGRMKELKKKNRKLKKEREELGNCFDVDDYLTCLHIHNDNPTVTAFKYNDDLNVIDSMEFELVNYRLVLMSKGGYSSQECSEVLDKLNKIIESDNEGRDDKKHL